MSNKDNMEDIFRRRFENEESPVSDRVWENIKQTLPPENPRRRFPFYIIAGILFLAGIITTGYYYSKDLISNSPVAATENTSEEKSIAFPDRNNKNKSFMEESGNNNSRENHIKKQDEEFEKETGKHKEETYSDYIDSKNSNKENNKKADSFSKEFGETKSKKKSLNKNKPSIHPIPEKPYVKNRDREEKDLLALTGIANKKKNGRTDNKNSIEESGNSKKGNTEISKDGNTINHSENILENNSTIIAKNETKEKGEKEEKSNEPDDKEITREDQKANPDSENKIVVTTQTEEEGKKTEGIHSTEIDKKEKDSTAKSDQMLLAKDDPIPQYGGNIVKDSAENKVIDDSTEAPAEQKPKDSLNSPGEKKEEKKENGIKFSVDIFGTPALTYRSLSGNIDGLKNPNEHEHARLNAGGGLRINYGVSEKLKLSGGIGIFSYGEKYAYQKDEFAYITSYQNDTIWIQDTTSANYYYVTKDTIHIKRKTQHDYSGRNYYRYMELPLSASYIFKTGKLGIGITGGVTLNVLLKAYTSRLSIAADTNSLNEVIEQRSGKDSPFKPVTFGAFINPTIVYNVKENWTVFAEPGFKFLFSSVYKKEANISLRPYGLNVNIGVRYIFK